VTISGQKLAENCLPTKTLQTHREQYFGHLTDLMVTDRHHFWPINYRQRIGPFAMRYKCLTITVTKWALSRLNTIPMLCTLRDSISAIWPT